MTVSVPQLKGSVHLLYPSARLDLMLSGEHDNIYQGMINKITLRYAPGEPCEAGTHSNEDEDLRLYADPYVRGKSASETCYCTT